MSSHMNTVRLSINMRIEQSVVMNGAYDPDDNKSSCLLSRCDKNQKRLKKTNISIFFYFNFIDFKNALNEIGVQ